MQGCLSVTGSNRFVFSAVQDTRLEICGTQKVKCQWPVLCLCLCLFQTCLFVCFLKSLELHCFTAKREKVFETLREFFFFFAEHLGPCCLHDSFTTHTVNIRKHKVTRILLHLEQSSKMFARAALGPGCRTQRAEVSDISRNNCLGLTSPRGRLSRWWTGK